MPKQLVRICPSDRFCRVQNLPTSSVELICPITELYFRQILSTHFMNIFYLDVKTGPYSRFSLSMEMSRLTRDGTAEPVSRDQILRHARGQGNIIFPVQLTTSRIGNRTRVIHTLLYVMTIHTYCVVMCNLINTYIHSIFLENQVKFRTSVFL